MIRLLGPPPADLLAQGNLSHKFFSDGGMSIILFCVYSLAKLDLVGDFYAKALLENLIPLEQRETTLEGEDKASFLRLVQKMPQWEPAKRSSAKELQQDEWIRRALKE